MNETGGVFNNKHFIWASVAVLSLGAIFMAVKTLNEFRYPGGEKSPVQNTITVSGKGEVVAIPDTATFSFSVEESAATVAEAQDKTSLKIEKILSFLEESGIEERDIKTIGYYINPKYEYYEARAVICNQWGCPPSPQNQKIVGYTVSQSIEVKVKDLKKAGDLLSGVGKLEAQNLSGLHFTVDEEDELLEEARGKAISDARAEAKKLAKDLGVRLVRIVSFSDGGNYYPIRYAAMEAYGKGGGDASAPSVEVPAGENKYTVNVTIVYEIR